jgi:hypothetical protein
VLTSIMSAKYGLLSTVCSRTPQLPTATTTYNHHHDHTCQKIKCSARMDWTTSFRQMSRFMPMECSVGSLSRTFTTKNFSLSNAATQACCKVSHGRVYKHKGALTSEMLPENDSPGGRLRNRKCSVTAAEWVVSKPRHTSSQGHAQAAPVELGRYASSVSLSTSRD